MRASPCVVLETALEARVSLLSTNTGTSSNDRAALEAQLDCLVGAARPRKDRRAGRRSRRSGAWREFVALLLEEHYDPAYRRSSLHNFAHLPQAATRVAIGSAEDCGVRCRGARGWSKTAVAA